MMPDSLIGNTDRSI